MFTSKLSAVLCDESALWLYTPGLQPNVIKLSKRDKGEKRERDEPLSLKLTHFLVDSQA